MGAIMCIGVATANSILVVTFANDQRMTGKDALAAALSAGFTRLRPVLMTALAMIIGMLPMASGLGEGGEQNAPLGRAVIGGLVVATFATLFFVPIVYSYLRKSLQPTWIVDPGRGEREGEPTVNSEGESSGWVRPALACWDLWRRWALLWWPAICPAAGASGVWSRRPRRQTGLPK